MVITDVNMLGRKATLYYHYSILELKSQYYLRLFGDAGFYLFNKVAKVGGTFEFEIGSGELHF